MMLWYTLPGVDHLELRRISNLEIQKRRKGHELNYSKIIDDYSELLRITQNYSELPDDYSFPPSLVSVKVSDFITMTIRSMIRLT